MSLQIGQQLGSYEITSLIGKGGMGQVYRARDSKLKRDVAIKILPDEFSDVRRTKVKTFPQLSFTTSITSAVPTLPQAFVLLVALAKASRPFRDCHFTACGSACSFNRAP